MDILLQAFDLRVEPGGLFEQKPAQLADRVGQARVRILKRRCQAVDMSGTLSRNDAELRQMAAPQSSPGVDRLGALAQASIATAQRGCESRNSGIFPRLNVLRNATESSVRAEAAR